MPVPPAVDQRRPPCFRRISLTARPLSRPPLLSSAIAMLAPPIVQDAPGVSALSSLRPRKQGEDLFTKRSRVAELDTTENSLKNSIKHILIAHTHPLCIGCVRRALILNPMSKRINIVLPETTIQTIARMARPGQRSWFINQAVQHYVANRSTEALRAKLERTAVRDRDLDREIAADWFAVDQEIWQRLDEAKASRKRTTRGAGKSTLRRSTRR